MFIGIQIKVTLFIPICKESASFTSVSFIPKSVTAGKGFIQTWAVTTSKREHNATAYWILLSCVE